jgi:adenine/guanine phosphoribosyltransferase-like PRPP-binding protein
MIKIEFEVTQNGYSFKDAIVLPENHNLTDTQIEEMKQKRFDDWYAIVTAPQPEEVIEESAQGEE